MFQEFHSFTFKPSHSARRSLNPQKQIKALAIRDLKKLWITRIFFKLPKAGLEPARIAPYAPETHVYTISPLRHIYYFIFLKNSSEINWEYLFFSFAEINNLDCPSEVFATDTTPPISPTGSFFTFASNLAYGTTLP